MWKIKTKLALEETYFTIIIISLNMIENKMENKVRVAINLLEKMDEKVRVDIKLCFIIQL